MIDRIEDFFTLGCGRCARFATPDCSTRQWAAGLAGLRSLCLAAGLAEHVKWGHPCYMHAGRNVVLIGALRGDFRLNFFNAALMKDPDGLLEKQGPNTRHPDSIRFTANEQVAEQAEAIARYLAEAMDYADKGVTAPRATGEHPLPDEMIEALDIDVELAEAFAALTPGRRNSYAVALNSARQSATRVARIARFRDRILAGKGANER
jgi:uncharacterized protein YdeI (YjbR/CyaY-like superfamily)